MKGRPRLVEEGTPIYSGDEQANDHEMTAVMIRPQHDDTTAVDSKPSAPPRQEGLSSLQRAALASGGEQQLSSRKARPKTDTSYVIGGGGHTAATINHPPGAHSPYDQYHPNSMYPHNNANTVQAHQSTWTNTQTISHTVHQASEESQYQYQHQPAQQQHHMNNPPSHQNMDHLMMVDHHDHADGGGMMVDHQGHHPRNANPHPSSSRIHTSFVVGGEATEPVPVVDTSAKMEGVEDHSIKTPLIVMDGANVAYAYAQAMASLDQHHHQHSRSNHYNNNNPEPDSRGIQVACSYLQSAGLRVLVVLPQSWFRTKPRQGDANRGNSIMETSQTEILHELKDNGLLVAAPPRDDDDAYALTIARREESRSLRRNGQGPGFVLSNDMFRDAMNRDSSGDLRMWLTKGSGENGPGRISYAFCDMSSIDDHGDRILDFIPNPRHSLVAWVENLHRQGNSI
jgi:hypothetical protein